MSAGSIQSKVVSGRPLTLRVPIQPSEKLSKITLALVKYIFLDTVTKLSVTGREPQVVDGQHVAHTDGAHLQHMGVWYLLKTWAELNVTGE